MLAKPKKHVLGVLLFLFVFITASAFTGFGNDERFYQAKWLSADARTRGRMAEDLVERGCLIGKNIDEVRETLGGPKHDWGSVYQYHIDLGWPMKRSESYGLQVNFDADQRVRAVKIVD